ncbi:Protein LURP-one-related 15 [Ceratobasidium theobromae]|uniref:Protein LURP-one-related 15 n=1 Tax=Ceratobasidium theobromae TaxID=1582974 RepID=A0A5N5QW88_9AGAM|nr:Protein LURP-one-related 15 [Ceratobasidium theobromae]
MGSSGSTMQFSPLVPQNPPLGVMPMYAQNYELTLKLREKRFSLSGDSFDITDPQGRLYFKMEGSVFNIRDKKTLKQADGRPIFNIQNKLLSIHHQYLVYNANQSTESEPLFMIKSHFSLTGAKIDVAFTNAADGRQVVFDLKGSFFDRSAEITVDGQPVARISRQFLNSGEIFFDQQTYYLTIAPGVDAAMMVALCVCLDEKRNEQ